MSETQVILAEPAVIAGLTIKPWTLKRFTQVYPVAKAMVEKLAAAGLTMDNLETFISTRLLDSLPELLPLLPELIALSADIPREQAEDLDWATAAAITMTIFTQNLAPLKNFSTLVPGLLGGTGVFPTSPSPA